MHTTDRHAPAAETTIDEPAAPKVSWAVLVLALAAQVLVVLDISVVNTAMPTMARDLQLGSSSLQWLVTAYLLLSGGGLLLGGRVSDLLPRRAVFMTGMTLFTVASLGNGFAAGAGQLIAGRAAQGAGAALMTPAALAFIMTTYSGAQRARGLALWGAIGGLGIAAGVTVGGALTTWVGWQAIFWVNVPIGVATLAAAAHLLPRQRTGRVPLADLDVPGAATAVAGLATLMYGLSTATSHGWTALRTMAALAAAAVLLAGFAGVERRAAKPLVHPHTWSLRSLVSGTAVMLGVTGLLMATVFLTSLYVQNALGYSAMRGGLVFLPMALALVVGTHVAAHLAAKLGGRIIAAAGLAIVGGGAFVLSLADGDTMYVASLLPGLVVVGLGAGMVFAAVSGAAMAGIPHDHAGLASGFLMTGHETGAALGVAALAAVAGTAGSFTTAIGAADAFSRGAVATGIAAVLLAGLAAAWMPAGKVAAGHLHH
jgi:EmrB/QacA subfamily drug resistance transporter